MVTQNRAWMFGDVVDGRMTHNAAGAMVVEVWREMASEFPRVTLDAFVIMPNHAHAILRLSRNGPIGNPTLGAVVQRFNRSRPPDTAQVSTSVNGNPTTVVYGSRNTTITSSATRPIWIDEAGISPQIPPTGNRILTANQYARRICTMVDKGPTRGRSLRTGLAPTIARQFHVLDGDLNACGL
jgi:hypothetical protein